MFMLKRMTVAAVIAASITPAAWAGDAGDPTGDTPPPHSPLTGGSMSTVGKTRSELTEITNAALRDQPGCETARVIALAPLQNASSGRNWEIPSVVLGDSLISDVDRAVITVHRQLGRKFHLVPD
jgi:hypothetical protein